MTMQMRQPLSRTQAIIETCNLTITDCTCKLLQSAQEKMGRNAQTMITLIVVTQQTYWCPKLKQSILIYYARLF